MLKSLGRRACVMIGSAALTIAAATGAFAQTIDTTGAWNGGSAIGFWGTNGTENFGQSITATSADINLKSFSFYLSTYAGPAINYRALIYKWDAVNQTLVGAPVYSSGILVSPVTGGSSDFVKVTINTAGTKLTPGAQYILVFSTTGVSNSTATTRYYFGSTGASYPGGDFIEGDSTLMAIGNDLAFIALFGPSSLSFAGLNPNQTAIAEAVNTALAGASVGGLAAVTDALTSLGNQSSVAAALDQLSPEVYNYGLIETLYGSQQFANDMMSCKVDGQDGASVIREGQCLWVRARARFSDFDHTASNIGAHETTGSFSAGGQVAIAPDWRLGFAAGYDSVSLTSGVAKSEGGRGNVGGIIKYNPGPLLLAAGVTGGWGSYDTDRTMAFGGFSGVAHGSDDIDYVSGQLHAAYLLQRNNWYLKPLVDAAITNVSLDGFTERDGGGAALAVKGTSDTVVSVSPGVEVGTSMNIQDFVTVRPFVRAGVTWQDTDQFLLNASFTDAPDISPFAVGTKLDTVLADVSAGIDLINTQGAVFRLQYDGHYAEDTQISSIGIKGSAKF